MGRNAKRKQDRKARRVTLSGEQAEVFDAQMDSDREWFDDSSELVRFRPEIEGEFNEYLMLGGQPPSLQAFDLRTGNEIETLRDWVCVVELSRVISGVTHGKRLRMRCPAPVNAQVRQAITDSAILYTRALDMGLRLRGIDMFS